MKHTISSRTYTLTLEGPYGEIKKVEIEVPFHFTAAKGEAKHHPDLGSFNLREDDLAQACLDLRDAVREDIKDIPASTDDDGRWVEFKMEGHQDLPNKEVQA